MQFLTLAYAAFVMGTFFEVRRMSSNWKHVGLKLLAAVVLSAMFVIVEPKYVGKWPLVFAGVLLFVSVAIHYDRMMAKIGEGVTLLHSLTLLYLCAEFLKKVGLSLWGLVIIFLPVAYSVLHALTHIRITKRDRLYLSLWSSLTMAVFALLYIYSIWHMDKIENLFVAERFFDGITVFLEHFLLGISGAYILQNFFMLLAYLPGRREFFNEAYFRSVREMNKEHIERYSSDQVDRREAWFVLILVGSLLALNYHFAILGVQFSIWICLVIVPFAMGYLGRLVSGRPD